MIRCARSNLPGLDHRCHAERIAAFERGGFKIEPQFARTAPGIVELRLCRLAGNFRVFVSILGARWIAEIVGVELRHHIHRRLRATLGDPFQNRASRDVEWKSPRSNRRGAQ